MFKVYIDCRERELIKLFEDNDVTHHVNSLDIGDILITDDNENVYCIIERKSIKDLNASLKDGRYKEQKHRLINNFNKKNILYLLEGYNSFESLNDKKIESAVIHSIFRDEIKFLFTHCLKDTYFIIMSILDRIIKNPQYFEASICDKDLKPYFNMATTKKSSNHDKCYIHKQMFCQIPSISLQTATGLYEHYGGFINMILTFQNKSIEDFTSELKSVKINNRKISKKVVENILKYI